MPDLPNHEEFGHVGQDKADHEPVTVYDKRYGAYKSTAEDNRPTTSGGSPDTIPTPFTLGKK